MEVAQIARALAYALGLNEDLAEALALAHDIGHPPFGHAGERALDLAMRKFGLRFDHNLHALRIVEYFELRYAAYRGLNLTLGLREGIVKHSKDYSASEHPELREYFLDQRPPLEAQLIDLADEIAYITADMEDGFEAEMLDIEGLSANVELFERAYRATETQYPNANRKLVFNEALRQILNTLVVDLIENTARNVRANSIESMEQIRAYPERLAALSPAVEALRKQAKQYLYSTLYTSDELQHDLREAATVVTDLFECWVSNPSLLPAGYEAQIGSEGAPRVVADYIAGMTDNFILHQHELWRRGSLPVQ
jgi:dGTPase